MSLDAPYDVSVGSGDEQHHFQNGTSLAAQACSSCRKQKRKCDKQLPACGLCQRLARHCDYSLESQGPPPSSDDFAALQQKVADLEGLLTRAISTNGHSTDSSNGGISVSDGSLFSGSSPLSAISPLSVSTWPGPSPFPSLFFLDSDAFQYEGFQIQAPYVKVPPGVLSALGSSIELREMIETYFATVHTYFPIVSRIRLYQHLSSPMHEPGADIALLFLAMKLVTSEIPEGILPTTQLYQDVKSFLAYVETQNGFSIQLLQVLLLVALYECGHSIYPACYLTIGHVARMGYAAGLHDREAVQMLPKATTWTELEERRRVWWAVVLLDRFVNIGHRNKPFATSDPGLDTHLPTDDSHWDRGQMLAAAPLALSASQTVKAAPFARTCQASHLLGKVIRHLNDKNLPLAYKFDEALQLHRTTRALTEVLPNDARDQDLADQPALCTSMAICYSALLTLYENYSCSERTIQDAPETQLVMQQESIDGISEVTSKVMYLARRVRSFIEQSGLGKVSPLIIDCIYGAAANYAWYVRESSNKECAERLAELKELLAILSRRWAVAGQYLYILNDFWGAVIYETNRKSDSAMQMSI